MTKKEAILIIKRIQYKLGFTVELENLIVNHMKRPISLRLKMKTLNADFVKSIEPTYLRFSRTIDLAALNEKEFIAIVHKSIRHMEIHEINEFFKVDGVKIFDPHKKSAA